VSGGVLRDVAEELAVSLLASVGGHRQGLVDRIAGFGGVPGVDNEGAVERVGCAEEGG
jgi:hypothetical protein